MSTLFGGASQEILEASWAPEMSRLSWSTTALVTFGLVAMLV